MSEKLWQAVDRLTLPTRERLERDTGKTEWVNLASLHAQLAEAVQSGRGSTGHGKQGSRPPLDVAAISLLIEIAETVADACRSYQLDRTRDTPTDLRSLASTLIRQTDNDDEITWWVTAIHAWCGRIRHVISNDQDRPWHLHGVACPECGAVNVTEHDDVEPVRRPAVIVTWSRGYVRAVECRMCTAVWYRGADLEVLVERLAARLLPPGVSELHTG